MDGRPVDLRIAGQSFKVVSTASDEELQRLARTISAKVEEFGHLDSAFGGSSTGGSTGGGSHNTRGGGDSGKTLSQAVLLAAISLAHELEEERAKRALVEQRARDLLQRVLGQIDEAIDCAPEQ